jgi:DNA-binding NarL/FixJ family response regulator
MMNKVNIVIADDHELILSGLITMLADNEQIRILACCQNGKELVEKVRELKPDLVLVDVEMPVMDGTQATREIKASMPHTRVIALTVHSELGIVTRMKEAGADGFLLKNISYDELILAIQTVVSNKSYYSQEITEVLFKSLNAGSDKNTNQDVKLTEREIEILRLIAKGCSNTEIGNQLFISPRTVDTHRTNLMKKINVNNIAGLVRFAYYQKLID